MLYKTTKHALALLLLSAAIIPTYGQWAAPDANGDIGNSNTGNVIVGLNYGPYKYKLKVTQDGNVSGNEWYNHNIGLVSQSKVAGGENQLFFIGTDQNNFGGVSYLQSYQYLCCPKPISINPIGGNVGIGTAEPIAKLSVNGDVYSYGNFASFQVGQFNVLGMGGNDAQLNIGSITNHWKLSDWAGNGNTFSISRFDNIAGAVPSFNLTKDGNLGVGTITPGAKLDVNGNVRAGGYTTGAANINSFSIEVGGTNPTQNSGNATIFLHHHNVSAHQLRYNSGNLYLEVAGNGYGSNSTPNFLVGGSIGIGTTSPTAKLDVNGNVNINGSLQIKEANGSNNTDPITFGRINNGANKSELRLSLGDDLNTTDDFFSIGVYSSAHSGAWKNFFTLNTKGELNVKKVTVSLDGWADNVLSKSYQLQPLSEVENYIVANQHLPNIPSEKEIKEKGLDTGEMLKLQMAKIEELTLHLIAQQKEIQALKAQMNK